MEFPTEDWDIFEAAEFETAAARMPSELCIEIMAQVRPNGQIMDHWRVATGGTSILEATVDLATIIPAASVQADLSELASRAGDPAQHDHLSVAECDGPPGCKRDDRCRL